ncbi:MAG: zf-HC2 domain-containing protein [Acidobacteriia bacterium]|jgi:anti-sigma factor RsiW|nr:zf-HC2 domain-containing protein [Terriglobia bacterium]
MDCRAVIRELSEYLDGELDRTLFEEVERHLAHCQDCRLVVNTTKKTIEFYCNSAPLPLPEDVRNRLHAALATRLKRPSP